MKRAYRHQPHGSLPALTVALQLLIFLMVGCQSDKHMASLPQAIAEVLASEPLDSGNTERYIVYAKRETFKQSETELSEDKMLACWKTSGSSLDKCTFNEMTKSYGADFNSKMRPSSRSYIDFVIRGYGSSSTAKVLFFETFFQGGINQYFELTMKWNGTKWEKESIKKYPFPMPID